MIVEQFSNDNNENLVQYKNFIQCTVIKNHISFRDNPNKAEVRAMNKSCLPDFKYFKNKKKTKILIHGFGDNVKESYMVPILKDGLYYL